MPSSFFLFVSITSILVYNVYTPRGNKREKTIISDDNMNPSIVQSSCLSGIILPFSPFPYVINPRDRARAIASISNREQSLSGTGRSGAEQRGGSISE